MQTGQATSRLAPVAAMLGSMLSIQYGATLATSLFPAIGAQGTTALRLALSAIMLAIVMRPWRIVLTRQSARWLILYGATLGFMNLAFFAALARIPLGIAVSIEFAGPLLVATLSSRRPRDFAWIALAAIGLALLSPLRAQDRLDTLGVVYAAAAAIGWGVYIVAGRRAGLLLGQRTAAAGIAIGAVLVLPVGISHAGARLFAPAILASALGVALFSSAVPFSLEMIALTRLPATLYGTLTSLEPALAAIMGRLILHQLLSLAQWSGVAIVVCASAGAALTSRAPPVRQPAQ